MKKSKFTHLFRRLRRHLRLLIGRSLAPRTALSNAPRPRLVTSGEAQAFRLWAQVVHTPESTLLYNPQSHEAYACLESPTGPVYLFLEVGNLRVINTVVGYDIRLTPKAEQYCASIFIREVNKRRSWYKRQAESKVTHSLDSLEQRLSSYTESGGLHA